MSGAPVAVWLNGGGVSAATCAHLLANDGFALTGAAAGAASSPAPVVLLSDAALALLRDLFGQPELFAGLPRISRRVVAWGGGAPVAVPHAATVVSGAKRVAELPMPALAAFTGRREIPASVSSLDPPWNGEDRGAAERDSVEPASKPFFTIRAAPPFPETALRCFGTRPAEAAAVLLAASSDRQACHVEAVGSGWLFLIPQGENAWLLGIGNGLDALLGESRLVAAQLDLVEPASARFETAPRMLERLCGPGWLACGTSAIAFDPICGDGTAQATREAVLAAAVVAGLRDGGDAAALLGHYQAMLIAAMRRHLQISMGFYRSGGTSRWWRDQAAALTDGYDWCTARLAVLPEPRFLLHGTRLVAREKAA